MRKIENWMLEVIAAATSECFRTETKADRTKDNTRIEIQTHSNSGGKYCTIYVSLHGNPIAKGVTVDGKTVTFQYSLAGWPTPTTKSRIRAIVSRFGGPALTQKKGIIRAGEKEISPNEWFN